MLFVGADTALHCVGGRWVDVSPFLGSNGNNGLRCARRLTLQLQEPDHRRYFGVVLSRVPGVMNQAVNRPVLDVHLIILLV